MPKRNVIWTIAIVAAGVATVLVTRTPPAPEEVRFRPVAQAYRTIRDQWYFPPDDAVLQRGAVRGMVEPLDEFSSYVAPDRVGRFDARLDGRIRSVGLLTERVAGRIEVIGALPGSPAHQAGIAPGGRLVAIDGRDAADYRDDEIRVLLEMPDPNAIRLTIADAVGRETTHELRRGLFPLETVTGLCRTPRGPWDHVLDANAATAYVRIVEFAPRTVKDLRRALRTRSRVSGVVLDLRDNPGGRIEAGFAVANLFLRKGVIFTRIDRFGARRPFSARAGGTHPFVPLVVLVNARTASAAEMVAGAMKRHDRAVLVGERTCGKALVQSMIPLAGGLGQVNLTTAEFLVGPDVRIARLPGRESWGIEPHRPVAATGDDARWRRRFWTGESVVPGVPASATGPTTAPAGAATTRPAAPAARALLRDPQLAEAARLLAEKGTVRKMLDRARAERTRRMRQAASSSAPVGGPDRAKGPDRE